MDRKIQRKRLFSQIFFSFIANLGAFRLKTGLCYPFFYCHACPYAFAGCPIGVIEHAIYKRHLDLALLFYPLLVVGSLSIVIGRAICGWLCPIGLLQRALYPISRKMKWLADKTPSHFKHYLRYAKYANLIILVFLTTYFVGFMFTDICPIGFLVGTIPISFLHQGEFIPNEYFLAALIVFIGFVFLILISGRGWCKYFCPLGALIGLFNKISLLRVEVDKDKCKHCNACSDACPMGIDVPNMERSPECILCGRCIEVCPYNAISFKVGA